jgi:hypothetical protein
LFAGLKLLSVCDVMLKPTKRRDTSYNSDAARISDLTGVEAAHCANHLRALLLAGFQARHPDTGFPLLAFRLHQFISRGSTIYTTLEPLDRRSFSPEGQVFKPGDRNKRLYPMAFCRMCGQDYMVVSLDAKEKRLEKRNLMISR